MNVDCHHRPYIQFGSLGTVTGISNFTIEVTFDE